MTKIEDVNQDGKNSKENIARNFMKKRTKKRNKEIHL